MCVFFKKYFIYINYYFFFLIVLVLSQELAFLKTLLVQVGEIKIKLKKFDFVSKCPTDFISDLENKIPMHDG